jgi:hypothetical protein
MENQILSNIDFSVLIEDLKINIFINNMSIYEAIYEDLIMLCDTNFICYKSNMSIIKKRKEDNIDYKTISSLENISRTVGESRSSCKSKINRIIHDLYDNEIIPPENWMSDDIVYSIGEMLDRISIEYIKQTHFACSQIDDIKKIEPSKKWEERVRKYLLQKLEEIEKKQFYEIAEEMRTYNV